MILTDREIAIALNCGQIRIDPQPHPDELSSTSVDLSLAEEALEWDAKPGFPIRPGEPRFNYRAAADLQRKVRVTGYALRPKAFLLAWTTEYVDLPVTSRLAARVEGKSSLARLGVGIHATAPTIHAGFAGHIQLEMFNFGPHQIILDTGMKICQIIFEQTAGTPQKGYSGAFAGQRPR
jgi:dCTP deaminase